MAVLHKASGRGPLGFLFALLLLFSPTSALYFYLDGTTPKCFYEELPKDTLVVGMSNPNPQDGKVADQAILQAHTKQKHTIPRPIHTVLQTNLPSKLLSTRHSIMTTESSRRLPPQAIPRRSSRSPQPTVVCIDYASRLLDRLRSAWEGGFQGQGRQGEELN
jgi:hypothetical protein